MHDDSQGRKKEILRATDSLRYGTRVGRAEGNGCPRLDSQPGRAEAKAPSLRCAG